MLFILFFFISDHPVGFTVTQPNTSSGNNLTFNKLLYNTGNGYDTTSGVFECQFPGIYLFSVTIVGNPSSGEESCEMFLNGTFQLKALANGDDGYHSGSTELVRHLSIGDQIYLASCGNIAYLHPYSSFSGVLIHPD